MEIEEQKICKYCGKIYLGRKIQKFCSRECFFNSLKKRVSVHCAYCGKEIIKPKRFIDKFKIFFCSRKCQVLYQKKSKIKKRCIVCGKEFFVSPSRKNALCCSKKCSNLMNNQKRRLGEYRECEVCGKKIYIKRIYLNQHKYHFCSNKCQVEWQKRNKNKGICIICGKKFLYSKSQNNRKTCSERCKGVWVSFLQSQNKGLNKLELKGREIIKEIDIEFQEQIVIENKFLVDVFIPSKKIVIQWDGDYWHNKPEVRIRDKSQNNYLKKCGYKVLRFWESEVYNQPNKIKDRIYETIRNSN